MLLGSIPFLYAAQVSAQNGFTSTNRFSANLLKDSLSLNPGQYGFNSLTILNHTGERLDIGLKIDLPSGWSLMRNLASYAQVLGGQSTTIPFRIKTAKNVIGGKIYPLRITIEDPVTGEKVFKIIEVKLLQKTDWRASLTEPTSYTSDQESLPEFGIKISNRGNRTELFDITFDAHVRLTMPSSGTQVLLKPGKDTLLNVGIRSRNLEQINEEIVVFIQARNAQKVLHQRINIISDEYKAHEFNNYYMPINVRWQGVNIAPGSAATQLFSAYGNIQLDNRKSLSFRTRLNFINGKYNKLNSYFLARYVAKRTELEIGNIQDFVYSQINGIGGRFRFRDKNKSYEVFP